jgi:Txe/YoeB family toxin of Txe-Axe toxin-antitoxin module
MDPQSNQDYGLNTPTSANDMATMPLPMPAAAPVSLQSPPVPAQAPPLSAMPAAALAPALANQTSPANPIAYPVVAGSQPRSQGASMPTNVVAAAPDVAADTDVIEKAWVDQAKKLVSETRNDPFKQSREINKLKADYMKKRYNKDIKLPDA